MKDSPYNSILNFKIEQKEYALLCKGKSKKYKLYTDWEEHIIECISKFKDEKDLYNFKRYCMNRERTSSKMPEMFATYIGLLITIYLDRLTDGLPLFVWLLIFVGIVSWTIIQHKMVIRESYFFKDLIDIIEQYTTNQKED